MLMIEQWVSCAEHLAGLTGIQVFCADVPGRSYQVCGENSFCAYCRRKEELLNTCLYGCHEAYRWNGKYIYYCPEGMIFAAASFSDERGQLAGGLVAGPILMGDPEDYAGSAGMPAERLALLPVLSTGRVTHLAETMARLTEGISGRPHSRTGAALYEQDKVLSTLYAIRQETGEEGYHYPLDTEKKLQEMIVRHDKKGSQELLNELLGHIYFAGESDVRVMKARALELAAILSRASIEAGADPDEIFVCSEGFLREVEELSSVEDIGAWLSALLHRFVDYSFDLSGIRHANVVFKVAGYVKAHFAEKITLDDVAGYVALSKPYLSRIYKEETGESLSSYINRVRVEEAERLLLGSAVSLVEVSGLCGFEDQSYFTKVFKRQTGVSPKRYRESRGNRGL